MWVTVAALFIVALLQQNSVRARPQYLDDYTVEEVSEWLEEHNLNNAFAETFETLQYDGDMLANFVKPSQFSLTDFPGATAGHVAKLFDRIQKFSRRADGENRRLAEESEGRISREAPAARRRQLSSFADSQTSGIRIMTNNSVIVMGEQADVQLARGGPDRLETSNELYVQGVDVVRAASGLQGGGIGWKFTHPGSKHFLRSAPDFILPPRFTIELWVKPLGNTNGKYFLSWASEDNQNCLILGAGGFKTANDWHHVVVTYDRRTTTVHDNGVVNMKLLWGNGFCGDYTGSLVFGQEQDTVGGGFAWSQGTPMVLDTVAIYNRDFSESERLTTGKTCVDMTDPSLITLWTGYTRGADQVGNNLAELYFDGFELGAVGNASCSNKGVGVGTPGPSYKNYQVSYRTPSVGAVGWVFPGFDTIHHFHIPSLVLPLDFTIETWVYPFNTTSGTYFFSWASPTNQNCFPVKAWFWNEPRKWYHFVVTWDGLQALVYVNGKLDEHLKWGEFCGDHFGDLTIGQEQDSLGGTFDPAQAPPMILDSLAIYSVAWTPEYIANSDASPCVDLANPDLYALYSGYSRGKDLVGSHDGSVTALEIVSEGQSITNAYQWYKGGEVTFDTAACEAGQESAAATAPSYDDNIVGGVGWDFTGDSITNYFVTGPTFVLPQEFTIEFWLYPRATQGYVMSWASEENQNCMLLRNDRITSLNAWHHIVVVTEKNGFFDYTTTVYVNGTKRSDFLHSNFCGNHTGSLAFMQEQDAVGGGFAHDQATNGILDTIAIYDTAWSSSRVGTDRAVGVDLQDTDLYALYSGFTRAKDLVGSQDGKLWLYQFSEGSPNSDASIATLEMLSPVTVGGVAWDFPAGTKDYFIQTGNFTLPAGGFAIEMWVNLNSLSTTGYFISYCVASNCNCLITQMSGFTSNDVGKWRHFVVTYDAENQATYTYLDGVKDQDFLHSSFCGDPGPGTLAIAQEQDAFGGGYQAQDAADIVIDTVAVYDSYWDLAQVKARKGQCVNLHDPSLFTLWSGYTRGRDLVGQNNAKMSVYDWAEGASLSCEDYH